MADYRISTQGLDEIKKSEALSLKAYQDTGGVWTIGYGHTGKVGGVPVGSGMTITKDQAERATLAMEALKQRCEEYFNVTGVSSIVTPENSEVEL